MAGGRWAVAAALAAGIAVGWFLGRGSVPDRAPDPPRPVPPPAAGPAVPDSGEAAKRAALEEEVRRLRAEAVRAKESARAEAAGLEAAGAALAWLRTVDPGRYGTSSPEEIRDAATLSLRGRDLRAPGEIARLGSLPRLRTLDLGGTRISRETLEAVARLPLERLVLEEAKMPPGAPAALAGMGTLKVLVLARTDLADEILEDLAARGGLLALEEVVLWNNFRLTDAGLAHLARLPRLRKVALSGCVRIGDAGLEHLSRAPGIEELDLESCRGVTDAGLEHLGRMKGLRVLDLGVLPITDEGLRHLAGLTDLRELVLRQDAVKGPGIRWLAALPRLETLDLRGTPIESLAELRNFPALRSLDVRQTRIPPEESARFAADFPAVAVDR